ncbi:MAG: hypothetical protein NWE89_05365 [Candidatus Bathyarchaeota archaeon]|nr:hypothetical protein [Candidatus Bathyarchaeota archaeon]
MMVHGWKVYELANHIARQLLESGLIAEKNVLMVRGITKIEMEVKE